MQLKTGVTSGKGVVRIAEEFTKIPAFAVLDRLERKAAFLDEDF